MRRHTAATLLSSFALAAAIACGDATSPKVTTTPVQDTTLLRPDVIDTEQLGGANGTDTLGGVFKFTVPAGATAETYFQKLDTGTVAVWAEISGGTVSMAVEAGKPTDDFEWGASRLIAPGDYQIHVRSVADQPGEDPNDLYRGAYRLEVLLMDSLPEHASPQITPGQVITDEAIENIGDLDAYTLSGTPGTEYNAFVSAPGLPPEAVQLDVVLPPSTSLTEVVNSTDTSLMRHPVGRFTMPQGGTVNLRVKDAGDGNVLYPRARGPYHLFVARIDSAPEAVPPVLTPGAAADTESIDMIGDVDLYAFSLSQPAVVNLRLQRQPEASGSGLAATLSNSAGDSIAAASVDTNRASSSTRDTVLAAGTYHVFVQPSSAKTGGFQGPYSLEVRTVDTTAETASGQLSVGDSVVNEAMDYAGDVDHFVVHAQAADTFRLLLHAPGGGSVHDMGIADVRRVGAVGGADTSLTAPVLTATVATDYSVAIASSGALSDSAARQAYVLSASRASAAPETANALLAFGDSVGTESIDYIGDIDDFVVRAAPGTPFVFRMAEFGRQYDDDLSGHVFAAGIPDTIRTLLDGYPTVSGLVIMPASGTARLRVAGPPGPYFVQAFAVDTLPETAPSALTLGDSVADAIEPFGDVDVYTFTGTAGTHATVTFRASTETAWAAEVQLVDRTTGQTVATSLPPRTDGQPALAMVLLPSSGEYAVRVSPGPTATDVGGYWLRVSITP